MKSRIQRALDGELAIDRLSAAEREELASYQLTIDQTLAELATGAAPDVSGAVMWRIAHATPEPATSRWPSLAALGRQVLQWFWQPRSLQFRPAVALGVLALMVASAVPFLTGGRLAVTAVPDAHGARQLVHFRTGVEGARDVALVGDFSGWAGQYPLEEVAPGVWSTTITLEPGVYDYAFVVDGRTWRLDPLAPTVDDGFGGANSRVSVLAPDRATRT